jgi:YVTN family beta-propeller protein
VVDATKHAVVKTIKLEGENIRPMGTVVSPDGKFLYVTTGRGKMVTAIDTATNTPAWSVEVGPRPWGIAIAPDGKTLYTANGPSNDVSVIDVASRSVTGRISVGDRPWGIALLP